VKKADGLTFAGWHQDSADGAALPVVLGGPTLSECGVAPGCLRGIPGSHRWDILKPEESDDPRSILSKGQFITDAFEKAVDFTLRPGEMVLFGRRAAAGRGVVGDRGRELGGGRDPAALSSSSPTARSGRARPTGEAGPRPSSG
jgi:hypothetical protein